MALEPPRIDRHRPHEQLVFVRRRAAHIQGANRMNEKGKKLEPKLKLDMPFAEALERFIQTKPKEVEKSIEKAKQSKPKQEKPK